MWHGTENKGAICDYCGLVAIKDTAREFYELDWDWFTFAMPRTRHACTTCKAQLEADYQAHMDAWRERKDAERREKAAAGRRV